jgi:hypothetical protein
MLNQLLLKRLRYGQVKKGLSLAGFNSSRSFSTMTPDLFDNRFLTSNMFCLVRNPLYSEPFISVTKNLKIRIEEGKTIKDMESETKASNQVKRLEFFTHDGAKIAKSTSAETLSSLPYFKMVLDEAREYIVISEKSFSFQNRKYELEGNDKKFYDYCKDLDMEDDKALLLSKYCSMLVDKLTLQSNWDKEDFVNEVFECLVHIAHDVREEKEILQVQYDLLKDHRRPLDIVKGTIEHQAEVYARRRIFAMFYFVAAQYCLVQYGTYILFSWDIMEPITCGMTLGDAVVAYFFWATTKSSYTLSGIFNYCYNKKMKKLAKKENFDQENYEKIETALKMLKNRIRELK